MELKYTGGTKVRIQKVIAILRKSTKNFDPPAIQHVIAEFGRDPFLILISCLLSLRTRDTTSVAVSRVLFARARTPKEILAIPVPQLEKMLHSIGFYRAKTRILRSVCQDIITRFAGKVPRTEQKLRSIKGIGQKTANAVLGHAFGVPALCVDTHVHQLANRLNWVQSKTADQTEKELKKIVPKKYWIEINYLLVTWGQNICTPVRPFCSKCAIAHLCPKIGVTKSR